MALNVNDRPRRDVGLLAPRHARPTTTTSTRAPAPETARPPRWMTGAGFAERPPAADDRFGQTPIRQPEGIRRIGALVDGEGAAPDPEGARGRTDPTSDPADRLVIDGATVEELEQGRLNDCFFVAAVGAVLERNPDFIDDAIQPNDDGTFTVRFFNDDGEAEHVTVDADLYRLESGRPAYAHATDHNEIWPAILEKGYAAWSGGSYTGLDEGGNGAEVIRALTGDLAVTSEHSDTSADDLWNRMTGALADGRAITAGSHNDETGPEDYEDSGLSYWHAYSVTDAFTDDEGQRWVELRNPVGAGSDEFRTDAYDADVGRTGSSEDGVFRMKFEDYQSLMRRTYTGHERPRFGELPF